MIAIGIGVHNFSEGLAIGQASRSGAIGLATILIVGFGLHNATEGFGIAAPLAAVGARPTWAFLALAGVIGGGPTFLGTMLGYSVKSDAVFVLFLALAAGSIFYVIAELLQCRAAVPIAGVGDVGCGSRLLRRLRHRSSPHLGWRLRGEGRTPSPSPHGVSSNASGGVPDVSTHAHRDTDVALMDMMTAITSRRSTGAMLPDMPPRVAIEAMLEAATYAPNHHRTEPWSFHVLTGDARTWLGEIAATSMEAQGEPEKAVTKARGSISAPPS